MSELIPPAVPPHPAEPVRLPVEPVTAPPALTTTATAKLIAQLQGGEVAAIEAALVSIRAAVTAGPAVAQGMLIEQAAILQALATKLFRFAGTSPGTALAGTFVALGLRALDLSRKSLGSFVAAPLAVAPQANVQVNVRATNELLDDDEERLVG